MPIIKRGWFSRGEFRRLFPKEGKDKSPESKISRRVYNADTCLFGTLVAADPPLDSSLPMEYFVEYNTGDGILQGIVQDGVHLLPTEK